MAERVLLDKDGMTVGELRAALVEVPDETWVVIADTSARVLTYEPGANEPFVWIGAHVPQELVR